MASFPATARRPAGARRTASDGAVDRRANRVTAVRNSIFILWLVQAVALGLYILLRGALTTREWAAVGFTLGYPLASLVALGVGVDLALVATATSVAGAVACAALCLLTGGLRSPFVIVLATIPSPSFTFGGARSAVSPLAIAAAALFCIAAVDLSGHLPGSVLPAGGSPGVVLLMAAYSLAVVGLTSLSVEASRARSKQALRQARDRAEDANRLKSQFLAVMSHELRTPMTGVIGMVDLLRETGLSGEQTGLVDTLRSSADALLVVLNDILDFSKIEAGELRIELVPFDPAATVNGVACLFAPTASNRGIVVEAHVDASVPPRLVGDPTRVRQVLANLIGNAVKFTLCGRVDVVARFEPPDESAGDSGGRLVIEVRDTGIGISPTEIARLFQPFRQADESTAREFGGTGLGLTICKRLCEEMGGSIEVESEPGEGSVFRCSFALTEHTADSPNIPESRSRARDPATSEPAPATAGERHPLRILIAEDNVVNQMVIEKVLARLGHEVTVVGNGALALDAVRTGTFDLVLMDMQMPVMDGAAATRAIRRLEGGVARLPIYALSADVVLEHQEAHLCAGLDGFLRKPIEWARIDEVLASVARRSPGHPSSEPSPSPA